MRVCRDADLAHLQDGRIAAIGYGIQGRAPALNLRDGRPALSGNREDRHVAREDGFSPHAQRAPCRERDGRARAGEFSAIEDVEGTENLEQDASPARFSRAGGKTRWKHERLEQAHPSCLL